MSRGFIPLVWVSILLLLLFSLGCGGVAHNSGGSGGTSGGTSGGNGGNPPAILIAISPTAAALVAGATQPFQATVTGSSDHAVQWQVNKITGGEPQLGTISSSGMYTAPLTSTALQVTVIAVANADPSKTASATVTVSPSAVPVVTVTVSPTSATLAISTNQQFTATVTGTNNQSVSWSVDGVTGGNGIVGTISSSGLYTAPSSAGAHTITATSVADNTKSASAAVSILSLTVSPESVWLTPNGTRQFTATIEGTSNTGVAWSVDGITGGNNTVGSISSTGFYTAPTNPGTHTVTATSSALPSYSVNATVTVAQAPPGAISVLTYHNDDVRDGANLSETILNPSNVNSSQFGKLAAMAVDGQVYAQPLYLPNLNVGGVQHNVVFVVTENDTVYAFDADGGSQTPLWQQHLATPVPVNDQEGVRPLLGITSTPVIDATTGTIYLLTDGTENGNPTYRLHALDVITGNEKLGGPVVVTGTVTGNGWDSQNGQIALEHNCYQRNGLALDPANNAIYISFGHCNHGWVLAYDKATLQQTAILNVTPDGAGGGLWGGTPAIDDSTGDLYLACCQNEPART